MPQQGQRRVSDEEFAAMFQRHGGSGVAKVLGIGVRAVMARRVGVEGRLGVRLISPESPGSGNAELQAEAPMLDIALKSGIVIVASDGHYWPGPAPTAHRALVQVCGKLKPQIMVFNGDAFDGASISRHPPIGWEHLPTVADELEAVQARLNEIHKACPRARHIWPLGNHDARFNTRLAVAAPEFRDVAGTRLVHHFPDWEPCWAVAVGGRCGAVIKHRYKGGVHAPHNNTVASGRTMVTGHLHSQKVTPYTDYNGTRWGVDTGCIARVGGKQFTYGEANPQNWRSGFVVLTWDSGELLPPELATVLDEEKGLVSFRGERLRV
jgi:hypothetical protein